MKPRAKVIPLRPNQPEPPPQYTGGMSPTDRLIDAVVIVAVVVLIFEFLL